MKSLKSRIFSYSILFINLLFVPYLLHEHINSALGNPIPLILLIMVTAWLAFALSMIASEFNEKGMKYVSEWISKYVIVLLAAIVGISTSFYIEKVKVYNQEKEKLNVAIWLYHKELRDNIAYLDRWASNPIYYEKNSMFHDATPSDRLRTIFAESLLLDNNINKYVGQYGVSLIKFNKEEAEILNRQIDSSELEIRNGKYDRQSLARYMEGLLTIRHKMKVADKYCQKIENMDEETFNECFAQMTSFKAEFAIEEWWPANTK